MSRRRIYITVLSFFVLSFVWLLSYKLNIFGNLELCVIKTIFQVPCPSCGGTRAIFMIINQQFIEAFKLNPLAYFMVLAFLFSFLLLINDFLRNKSSLYNNYIAFEHFVNKYKYVLLVLILLNWVWSIEKGI